MECITCNSSHKEEMGDTRIKVILSTIEMHDSSLYQMEQPSTHIYLETIYRGRLSDLLRCWENQFGNEKKEMDVVVISGKNEILHLEAFQFIDIIARFKQAVRAVNVNNTFTISEMLRPPKYCWFPMNGPEPEGMSTIGKILQK